MNKAFHTLVDDRTDVSVETGLRAAEKLQSVLHGHEQGTDIARMRIELGRIIDAVKSTVPQSMWGEIVEKLDPMEQYPESIVDETDAYGESDDVFDPTDFAEEDDEL
jgi:hypothetical protein